MESVRDERTDRCVRVGYRSDRVRNRRIGERPQSFTRPDIASENTADLQHKLRLFTTSDNLQTILQPFSIADFHDPVKIARDCKFYFWEASDDDWDMQCDRRLERSSTMSRDRRGSHEFNDTCENCYHSDPIAHETAEGMRTLALYCSCDGCHFGCDTFCYRRRGPILGQELGIEYRPLPPS